MTEWQNQPGDAEIVRWIVWSQQRNFAAGKQRLRLHLITANEQILMSGGQGGNDSSENLKLPTYRGVSSDCMWDICLSREADRLLLCLEHLKTMHYGGGMCACTWLNLWLGTWETAGPGDLPKGKSPEENYCSSVDRMFVTYKNYLMRGGDERRTNTVNL